MGIRLANARFTTKYIGRYTKRPVIAESRIKDYDGRTVTFEYEDKSEQTHRVIQLPIEGFISRLVRHIHDKHFRQIRYYGIYSTRSRKQDLLAARAILLLTAGKQIGSLNWRQRRKAQNGGIDPLICHHCGAELMLVKIVYKSRDGPLKEFSFI